MVGPHIAPVVVALVRDPGSQLVPLTSGTGTEKAGVGYKAATVLGLARALHQMGVRHRGVHLGNLAATEFRFDDMNTAPVAGHLKLPTIAVLAAKLLSGWLAFSKNLSAQALCINYWLGTTLSHLSPAYWFARAILASPLTTRTVFLTLVILNRLALTCRVPFYRFGLHVAPLAPATVTATVNAKVTWLLFNLVSVARLIWCQAGSSPLLHAPAATGNRASAPGAPLSPNPCTSPLLAGFTLNFAAVSARLAQAGPGPLSDA